MENSATPVSTALSRPLCPEPVEGSPHERRDAAFTQTAGTEAQTHKSEADPARHGEPVESRPSLSRPAEPQLSPLVFIQETADARTRLYSARDERGSIYAAFYADGRLRVAFEDHRLAGIVQNGHAHLLDMNSELWSEVFVRVTPEGALQLELRDGPLDGRVLTCEALQA